MPADEGNAEVRAAGRGVLWITAAKGYFMVASDGGVFAFGDAEFHGSTGAIRLNRSIVAVL